MFGKRFQKELEMIDQALASERGEKEMRAYIAQMGVVRGFVQEYFAAYPHLHTAEKELEAAGWTHFGLALRKYKERADDMLSGKNDIYYFSSYFGWFVRQGMREYCQKNGLPVLE